MIGNVDGLRMNGKPIILTSGGGVREVTSMTVEQSSWTLPQETSIAGAIRSLELGHDLTTPR